MYVVVTRYEKPNGKRPITHAYTEGKMGKPKANKLRSKIIREHRSAYPNDKGTLTVSVLKIVDVELLNKTYEMLHTDSINARNIRQGVPMQDAHRGPSGEVLI